ncbi:hypothetical protein B0H16DRAFT_1723474 [Mycena metata]|uniref:Uncharacterized protein n=1 Tax=Mycena metata TaxID=1033252 RepID=A0AAD7NA05_9AGAR|nr:hypothetical protein B0H16DRAFT_1723474 [Mycena metata]
MSGKFTAYEDLCLVKFLAVHDKMGYPRASRELYALLGPQTPAEFSWSHHRPSASWRTGYKNNRASFDERIEWLKRQSRESSPRAKYLLQMYAFFPPTIPEQEATYVASPVASSLPSQGTEDSPSKKELALANLKSLLAAEKTARAVALPTQHRGELKHPSFVPQTPSNPKSSLSGAVARPEVAKASRPVATSVRKRRSKAGRVATAPSPTSSTLAPVSSATVPAPLPAPVSAPVPAPPTSVPKLLSTPTPPTATLLPHVDPADAAASLNASKSMNAAHRAAKTHRKLARMARRTKRISVDRVWEVYVRTGGDLARTRAIVEGELGNARSKAIHTKLARLARKSEVFSKDYVWDVYAKTGSVVRVGKVLKEMKEAVLKARGGKKGEGAVDIDSHIE